MPCVRRVLSSLRPRHTTLAVARTHRSRSVRRSPFVPSPFYALRAMLARFRYHDGTDVPPTREVSDLVTCQVNAPFHMVVIVSATLVIDMPALNAHLFADLSLTIIRCKLKFERAPRNPTVSRASHVSPSDSRTDRILVESKLVREL